MKLIRLSALGLSVAALLVLLLAFISWRLRLGVEKRLLIAALRSVIQLLLLGMVLKTLFSQADPLYVLALTLFMPSVTGHEVMAQQQRHFIGIWSMRIGTISMFISSFTGPPGDQC